MNNDDMISWSDFAKVDMRIGTILTAEVFEEAKNSAYKMTVDFGPFGTKKTSAQITTLYQPIELIGRQVVAVVNFPPKQIATMMSECLVMGGLGDNKDVILLSPERTVPNGTKIG
ncbi:MAG: tRNA-binding protein [Bacteroidetes bacterium]|nr:tRNA-binding protein [Bacteroidota bacterium]